MKPKTIAMTKVTVNKQQQLNRIKIVSLNVEQFFIKILFSCVHHIIIQCTPLSCKKRIFYSFLLLSKRNQYTQTHTHTLLQDTSGWISIFVFIKGFIIPRALDILLLSIMITPWCVIHILNRNPVRADRSTACNNAGDNGIAVRFR